MVQKIKKIFENAVWWSGVVMVGLIFGVSLQFVRAWTEPTDAPPGGNVGAPVNTGLSDQAKAGGLGVLSLLTHGLQLFNDSDWNDDGIIEPEHDVTGKFLKAADANGQVAWAAGGDGSGGIYTVWGPDTCPSGDTKIYSGEIVFLTAKSRDPLCLYGTLYDYATPGYEPYDAWSNGHDVISAATVLHCAVCER